MTRDANMTPPVPAKAVARKWEAKCAATFRTPTAELFTINDPRIETCPTSGCWLWLGSLSPNGYGRSNVRGQKGARVAHRMTWERANGAVPEGKHLDHICRTRCCVNPDHLRAVTPRENALFNNDSPIAKRNAQDACSKCGGPFTHRSPSGYRRCAPCDEQYRHIFNERRRERRGSKHRRRKVAYHEKYLDAARTGEAR